jgi:UDP-N-acetylmuramate--alanine ligase
MKYHLIGIKGVGMTAIAQVLKASGHKVKGSDTNEEFFTDIILKDLKIPFTSEFKVENITDDIDIVIKSSAYDESNPEVQRAKKINIPILDYPMALSMLSEEYHAVAIAGTHGKTTQSALLSILCIELGLDPLCIVGSSVPQFGNKNARIQDKPNDLFIAETCEYKNNFLSFSPNIILIPSLDYDHVDFFMTIKEYEDAFIRFCQKLPQDGILVICADSLSERFLREITKIKHIKTISYGFKKNNNIRVEKPTIINKLQNSKIKEFDFEFQMSVPGDHNILNAVGAIIVLDLLSSRKNIKIDYDTVKTVLLNFRNTKRRLEKLGTYKEAIFIDDYAHHPVEIEATIKSLKSFYKNKKIKVIFQSHTFSRSKKMEKEFASSFKLADEVIIAPIYPSAREVITKYTSKDFAQAISKSNKNSKFFESYDHITKYIKKTTTKNDIIVAMGAGDIWKTLMKLL